MKAFTRKRGLFIAQFEPAEAELLCALAGQLTQLLEQHGAETPDPAIARLLPDAYPGDDEASEEFRRFTADGLAERKVANAVQVMKDLESAATSDSTSSVQLGVQAAGAWMKCLTDIRLTIANRLGITTEDEVGSGEPALLELYDWLGFVQGSLIDSVDH